MGVVADCGGGAGCAGCFVLQDQMLIVAGVYVVFVLISFAYWTAFVSQPKLKKQASTATQNFGAKKGERGEVRPPALAAAAPLRQTA